MTALRIVHPGEPVRFIPADPTTEPGCPYRNPFRAPSLHKLDTQSGLARTDRAQMTEYQRRYVARKRAKGA